MQPATSTVAVSQLAALHKQQAAGFSCFLLNVLSSKCLMRALEKHALETRTVCLHGCNKASLCQNLSVSDQTGVMHSLPGCWTASRLHTSRS